MIQYLASTCIDCCNRQLTFIINTVCIQFLGPILQCNWGESNMMEIEWWLLRQIWFLFGVCGLKMWGISCRDTHYLGHKIEDDARIIGVNGYYFKMCSDCQLIPYENGDRKSSLKLFDVNTVILRVWMISITMNITNSMVTCNVIHHILLVLYRFITQYSGNVTTLD